MATDLAGPDGRLVRAPRFDFATMRRSETGSVKADTLRHVMVVDVMLPVPTADLTVRLEGGPDERRRRLGEREVRWGTNVLARWDRLEASRPEVPPQQDDLILDGQSPPADLAWLVLSVRSQRFRDDLACRERGDGSDALS